jgi:lincosamide nucleotidyltransferase A/C/D/E
MRLPSTFSGGSAGVIAGSVWAVMSADDVLALLALFRTAAVDVWVGGGWGIDALVGRETRPHRDLDLMHRVEQEPTVIAALAAAEFAETLDWRPVRFVVTDPAGREIDLHPLTFAPDGSAVQASLEPDRPFAYPARCFVTGTIGGAVVPCLSAEQQVYFHQGYEPKDRDRHDMAQLRGAFGIDTYY